MAQVFKRHGSGFMAGVFAFFCMSMVVASVVSSYWVMADLERTVVSNRTEQLIKGGSKYFGLFNGYSEIDFGLGPRKRKFTVKSEFDAVANDDVVWATVAFCVLSVPVMCIVLALSCYNEFSKPSLSYFGPIGIYICSGIAFLLLLIAACLYAALFDIQLKKNVLRPEDQKNGFSSSGKARLGYSYWLVLGAAFVVILCPLTVLLHKFCMTWCSKSDQSAETRTADGVMLY